VAASTTSGGCELAAALTTAGVPAVWSPTDEASGCGTVVLPMGPALRGLLEGPAGILQLEGPGTACVQEVHHGSLVDVVNLGFDWMVAMKGEGMVLTYPDFGSKSGTAVLGKWKCAQEPQSKNVNELKQLVAALSGAKTEEDQGGPVHFPPKVHFLLPSGVVEMVHKMLEVATAQPKTDSAEASKATTAAQKAGAAAQATGGGRSEGEMEEVLASALTKFDHIHSYFAQGKKAEVVQLLVQEVRQDLKAEKGDPVWGQATKLVNRHVGMEFGTWRKQRNQLS
jgi:hypothetical protein